MIQPVIAQVESNRESVQRLLKHCRELDQTEVKVIAITPEEDAQFKPKYPNNDKACRASFSLHRAALEMKGKPFIWLEHDAIPLKPRWVERLSAEYGKCGKPFVLSADSNPPHDHIGGIGIYGGDTHWMIPQHFRREPDRCIGWDLWMIRNIPDLIHRTNLIQHSYGIYDVNGIAEPHRFPRDQAMLRTDALIFHADKSQSLLGRNPVSHRTFYHSGDIGDILYHLEVIRRAHGGNLYLGPELAVTSVSRTREPMTQKRFDFIRPLIEAQDYIHEVKLVSGKPNPDWINLNLFREKLKPKESLQRACLRRFGYLVQDETKPWLQAETFLTGTSPIIIARSPRYHREEGFPWKGIVEKFGDRIQFVGLPSEYADFCTRFGHIPHRLVADLLDMARLIQASQLFIGNQSCPYAIAEGLKKPAIQETWLSEPNCLFERPHLLANCSTWKTIEAFIEKHLTVSNCSA